MYEPASEAGMRLFWDQLLQFIDERRVVTVVGQDLLTVRLGGRDRLLYTYLAEQLARELGLPQSGDSPATSLNAVACQYLATGKQLEDVYPALKKVMPLATELSVPEPLRQLAAISPLKLFVTTTFDSLLERALDEVRFGGESRTYALAYSPSRVVDLPADVQQLDRPIVFHLLGQLSTVPDYAVTEEDTLEFVHSLQSETRRPQRLFDELNAGQLLIIGSSFSNWLARFFIRLARRERLWHVRGKTDVLADDRIAADTDLVMFLKHFSARTKIFPGGAVAFVNELHARWTAAHPASSPVPPEPEGGPFDMEPGAVFISYASEDRTIAETLSQELERHGVDVWFDRQALQPGDAYEAKIRRNIDNCSLFLPLISRHSLTSKRRFFRIEWDHAERVAVQASPALPFIIPVAVDDTPVTEPALPDRFRRLHWERLPYGRPTPEFGQFIRKAFRDYQKSVGGGGR